jgi:hypothetical protein
MNFYDFKKFNILLEQSIVFEDNLVVTFTEFLQTIINKKLVSLSEGKKNEIIEIINKFHDDSNRHKDILIRLKTILEKKYDQANINQDL